MIEIKATEMYGAYWFANELDGGYRLTYKRFEPNVDLIAAVYYREPIYRAVVLEKVIDPGFLLPVWDVQQPEALFDAEQDAIAHAETLVSNEIERKANSEQLL